MGVITEASMRLQDRPTYRSSCTVEFTDYENALSALKHISQAGLFPANCRLLDSNEALFNGAGDGTKHLLILSFESADHDKTYSLDRALEISQENNGIFEKPSKSDEAHRSGEYAGGAQCRRLHTLLLLSALDTRHSAGLVQKSILPFPRRARAACRASGIRHRDCG